MTSLTDPRAVATLIYLDGCHACAGAKPEFDRAVASLAEHVRGRHVDIEKVRTTFPLTAFPTLLLQLPGRYVLTDPRETPMSAAAIRVWLMLGLQAARRAR
jgi:hypothetical protein